MESKGAVSAYLWHNDEAVVHWLEEQGGSRGTPPSSVFAQNIEFLKKESVLRQVNRWGGGGAVRVGFLMFFKDT